MQNYSQLITAFFQNSVHMCTICQLDLRRNYLTNVLKAQLTCPGGGLTDPLQRLSSLHPFCRFLTMLLQSIHGSLHTQFARPPPNFLNNHLLPVIISVVVIGPLSPGADLCFAGQR